jgi:hypothetical protein
LTPDALATLSAYADVFETRGFEVGEWHGGQRDRAGAIELPWVEYSDEVDRFVADMYRVQIVHDIDWMRWAATPRGSSLLDDPAQVATATADELSALLTAVIRGERFGDGQIEAAFERGVLQAAARRAAELTAKSQA